MANPAEPIRAVHPVQNMFKSNKQTNKKLPTSTLSSFVFQK